MKTSKKQMLALLLAAAMATSMAACSTDGGSSSSESSASGSSSASSDSSAASGEESSTAESDASEVSLPLADGETLSCFNILDANAKIVVNDYNDNEFWQELERRTGVHIEWQMTSSADANTNFNLMIASNNLPDMLTNAANYSDGIEAAIDDGYYLELTDKIDEYMPNYAAFRTSMPEVEYVTSTDSGRIGAVFQIYTEPQGPWLGMQVRQDWLDKLGMDTPVTYDDWEEMLTAFKNEMGAYAPLSLTASGFDYFTGAMSAGYGVTATWQLDETGKVVYGPYTDGWRQYITKMNDWFNKGLIDPDFMTQDSMMVDMTSVVSGKTGVWQSSYTMASTYEASSEDPGMVVMPIQPPVQNEGDELHIRWPTTYVSNSVAISAQCEKWELAMRWMDYFFTDEGAMLANYGIEGDTYTLDENGDPVFTDKMLNNPDYTFAQAISSFTLPPSTFSVKYDWHRETLLIPEKDVASFDVWGATGEDWVILQKLSLNSDEKLERGSIMTDIETFAKEQTTQMITGVLDVETNWDSYISTIQSMGIDRATEISQAAYDRYLQR